MAIRTKNSQILTLVICVVAIYMIDFQYRSTTCSCLAKATLRTLELTFCQETLTSLFATKLFEWNSFPLYISPLIGRGAPSLAHCFIKCVRLRRWLFSIRIAFAESLMISYTPLGEFVVAILTFHDTNYGRARILLPLLYR